MDGKPNRSRRIPASLVALSSAAIVSVFAVGYARTEPAFASLAAQALATPPAIQTQAPTPTTPAEVVPTNRRSRERDSHSNSRSYSRSSSRSGQSPTYPSSSQNPTPTPTPSASQPSGVTVSYRDGTYVGQGRCRFGTVEATVVVKGGRIVSASISKSTTSYPSSLIAGLPPEVVTRQSDQVDLVSGATYSSLAYQQAVAQALAQAG